MTLSPRQHRARKSVKIYLLTLGVFLTTTCHPPVYLSKQTYEQYVISDEFPDDTVLQRFVASYKSGIDSLMTVVIARTDIPLTKAQPECLLGNFMADAQLLAAQRIDSSVVASVVNYGGIRRAFFLPGEITREDIYELMPFENTLTILEIPGNVLKKFCNHMARYGGWPVSGLRFAIEEDTARDIYISEAPLNEFLIYKIVVSNYLAGGGDHCTFLRRLNHKQTSILLRDALLVYLEQIESKGEFLHPTIEKRVYYVE